MRLMPSILLLLLAACADNQLAGGAGAGNPDPVRVEIALAARLKAPAAGRAATVVTTLFMTDSSGTRFVIERMLARCDRMEIALPDGASCPATGIFEGACVNGVIGKDTSIIFDLLDTTNGAAVPLAVPPGLYTRASVHLSALDAQGTGEYEGELTDRTLSIVGTLWRGTTHRPYRLDLRREQTLDFRSTSGIHVPGAGSVRFRATLDPRGWLSGVDIGKCLDQGALPGGTDTLVLDENYPCGDLESESSDEARNSARLDEDIEE